VEVLVANPARKLRAGSFAKASVFTRQDAQAPTIPEEALVTFAGVTKVFVVRDGKARAVTVRPGVRLEVPGAGRTENWVEVLGEVPPDSQVVTSGHSQLAEGTPVRIRTSAPTTRERNEKQ
jgi:multidrug efflux pump subunit AcrA (membrane-fusion protein)